MRRRSTLTGLSQLEIPPRLQEGLFHDLLRFRHYAIQMIGAPEAFRVEFVDVLGAGWPGGKPTVGRRDFQAADRRIVAGRIRQPRGYWIARKRCCRDGLGREVLQLVLRLRIGRRVDTSVERLAKVCGDFAVMLARVFAGASRDLGGEEPEDEPVLVGRPDFAVAPKNARAGALLAAETTRSVEQPRREPFEADGHFPQLAPKIG